MDMLTPKQERFCNYYIETGNASEAYRRAYDARKMKPDSVNRKAFELLENVKIAARVRELQEEFNRKSDLTKEEALRILGNMAKADVGDALVVSAEEFKNLPEQVRASVQSVEIFSDGKVKVRMYNKIDAIDRLSKMLGWDSPQKVDVKSMLFDIDTGDGKG